MGRDTFSKEAYTSARRSFVSDEGPATRRAEQEAHRRGTLNPLVDPSGYGVIRRSLCRFVQRDDGLYVLSVGAPIPIETRVDTTGSMGGNVDIAIDVLPKGFDFYDVVLKGRDPQVATGIFGDVCDRFVLCRPQFEMTAEKIVEQLTLMVPERDGGDIPEDPHYGIFGAAYLTAAFINRIGIKGYDFTVSDAPARYRFDPAQLIRIFGKEVFEKVIENGHKINKHDLPDIKEVVQDLLKISHAFFLQVNDHRQTTDFWTDVYGRERVVALPDTKLLPHVQGVIIGLSEGTLCLGDVFEFLKQHNVSDHDTQMIVRSVSHIPLGAQTDLPNFSKIPKKGDIFRNKTDLWPIDPSELSAEDLASKPDEDAPDWL